MDLDVSQAARRYLSIALIGLCLGGALLNEVLRAALTLDSWMWVFAFARIELIFAVLIALVPMVTYFDDDNEGAKSS